MTALDTDPFRWGRDYYSDDSSLRYAQRELPDAVADLQDIASAAYLIDRSVRRGDPDRGEGRLGEYARPLLLQSKLRRPGFWSGEAEEALRQLLAALTDDEWDLVLAPSPQPTPTHCPLFAVAPPDDVALFSGGLDAVAGTALTLATGARIDGISVETNRTMGDYQRRTARELHRASDGRFRRLPVHLQRLNPPKREEPTRRTRGLVFLVAGFAAAVAAGRDRLLVFENGVGAINLPYVDGQRGSMTSRAVHPQTLMLAERLFSLVLDRPFSVMNPCLALSKGQLLARVDPRFAAACGLSESCDRAASGRGTWRCGGCTSCLLRRQSFYAAARVDWDPRPYARDVLSIDRGDSRLPEMLWQAHRLHDALGAVDPVAGLSNTFPELEEVISLRALPATELVGLYATYAAEWRRFPHPDVAAFLGPPQLGRVAA